MATARPTALVFASLILGQLFNLAALSLLSAHLGLAAFGRFGICMLDFTVFASVANFALAAPSMPMVIRGRFRHRLFATAMGARLWTSGIAMILYLAFEAVFREREMFWAAVALAPALFVNPSQWDWWFAARQSWRPLLFHRILGGLVTLGVVLAAIRLAPHAAAGPARAPCRKRRNMCAWSTPRPPTARDSPRPRSISSSGSTPGVPTFPAFPFFPVPGPSTPACAGSGANPCPFP